MFLPLLVSGLLACGSNSADELVLIEPEPPEPPDALEDAIEVFESFPFAVLGDLDQDGQRDAPMASCWPGGCSGTAPRAAPQQGTSTGISS